MDSLSQSPPDSPTTEDGQAAVPRKRLGLGAILVCLVLGLALCALVVPVVKKQRNAADRTSAISSLKGMGPALFGFEADYGRYPDASTIPLVIAKSGTKQKLGDASSNELFRQLIEDVGHEKVFWAKSAVSPNPPDEDFSPGKALERGECGFGYVAGLTSSNDGNTTIVFGPLVPGTERFDPQPYEGMAVILRLDNSATPMRIRGADGKVPTGVQGLTLFDPQGSYWGGKAPDLKLPE